MALLYQTDPDRKPTLPPDGLGSRADTFTGIYQETFKRIVLQNENVVTVLNEEVAGLQQVVDDAKAPCWAPDPPSPGPCRIN